MGSNAQLARASDAGGIHGAIPEKAWNGSRRSGNAGGERIARSLEASRRVLSGLHSARVVSGIQGRSAVSVSRRCLAACLICCLGTITMPASAQDACGRLSPGEQQVVEDTNRERAAAGQPKLIIDCRLMSSARRHARRMARDMELQHSSDPVSENVTAGPPNAREAVVVWMSSPSHRKNILDSRHRRIGVAGFIGKDGRAYWVQQFLP